MRQSVFVRAVWLSGGLLVPAAAGAQTAIGSPAAPAPPALVGTPRPISRAAPGARVRAVRPDSPLPDAKMRTLPKPTAAELAEKRKLDHDLKICIGC